MQKATHTGRSVLYITIIIFAAVIAAIIVWAVAKQTVEQTLKPLEDQPQSTIPTPSTAAPQLKTQVVVSGRQNIWDIGFLPSGDMLFTERKGVVSGVTNGAERQVATIDDVRAVGEGGLMGLAIDRKFTDNRYIYTCYNSTKGPDVRVVRWKLKSDVSGLEDRNDIITGLPSSQTGRHSGCRLAFGPDDNLWIGTGDAANETTPQSTSSLGGKILRVDRNGKGVAGNQGAPFDARVYSYGHRNTQGIAFFTKPHNDIVGVSVEHGSTVDDEVNLLTTGNFGWAPGKNYNESGIAMTDKARFAQARDALWSSGSPTQAPSGAAIIKGAQWKAWDGALMVAMLKAKHLKMLLVDSDNKVTKEEKLFQDDFGRLRAATLGPNNDLYISTDNDTDDKIIRITAQ